MNQAVNATAIETRVALLEAQAARYQAVLDASSQGIAFFDREQRLILANRRYAEIYRLTPDQIPPGTTLREITERRAALGNCPIAVDDYVAYVSAVAEKRESRDWTISVSGDRTIEAHFRPMPDGGWVAIHEDITEAMQRRLLIEERLSLQSLIDVVPDNLWVKDTESRFVVANRATAQRMGHVSPDELIGKSDLELCPWETAQKYLADEREVIETGCPMVDGEEYILGPEGAKTWVATTKAPLRNDNGDVVGIIGVSRDVTRRRLADALTEGQAEILQLIACGAPKQTVFEELAHLIESQSRNTVASIMLLSGDEQPPNGASSLSAIAARRADLLAGPLGKAARLVDLVIVPEIARDPSWIDHWALFSAFGLRSCWSAPIVSRAGASLGVVAIFAGATREPNEGEVKLLQTAAQLAAIAAERNKPRT